MSAEPTQDELIAALIELHVGLERQGPGDPDFTAFILGGLPELPARPRIADLGCGAGAGALPLAAAYRCRIRAVDFARPFLKQMMARAQAQGLDAFIEPVEAEIGNLGWDPGCLALLRCEGAAYNIGFDHALECWQPLLAPRGIAVLSEMNYFHDDPPPALRGFMTLAYPPIRTEADIAGAVTAAGFELLGVHRLPTSAWWRNYYDPLRARIASPGKPVDAAMRAVIDETEHEMRMFENFADDYGYTYYVMRVA